MTETATAPVLLTYDDVVSRIEKVIEGREDYVNAERKPGGGWETCRYVNEDGTASCIVGTLFYDEILETDLGYDSGANTVAVGTLLSDSLADRVQVTAKALRFLESVQGLQDTGASWGSAVADAKEGDYTDAFGTPHDDTVPVEDPATY